MKMRPELTIRGFLILGILAISSQAIFAADEEDEVMAVMEKKFQAATMPKADDLKLGFTWKCTKITSSTKSESKRSHGQLDGQFKFFPLADGVYDNSGCHWSSALAESLEKKSLVASEYCSDRRIANYKRRVWVRIDSQGNLIGKEKSDCDWRNLNTTYFSCPLVLVENLGDQTQ